MGNRYIIFDPNKVRLRANELGIKNRQQFETRYSTFVDRYTESVIPTKVWEGKRIYRKNAVDIATILELESYHELEYDNDVSAWDRLVNTCTSEAFSEMIFESEQLKGMFSLEEYIDTENLKKIDVSERFKLKVHGKLQEHFAIFFISDNEIYQLAPITNDEFNNCLVKETVFYPNHFIPLKENRIGWCSCVIVKGTQLPIAARSVRDVSLTKNKLDLFAIRLAGETVQINVHEFMLVS